MQLNTRRKCLDKFATIMAAITGARSFSLSSLRLRPRDQTPPLGISLAAAAIRTTEFYYFSGTGSNDGYPREDHVLVTV
jgi:hypothetical protein